MTTNSSALVYQMGATPDVPGLRLRGFQGDSDYPKMVAVIQSTIAADQVERNDTVESMANLYAHLHNCDLSQDLLLAEVDDQVVGYIRVWWDVEAEGNWLGWHVDFLHPDWRGKGIGTAMFAFAESRLRTIAGQLAPFLGLLPEEILRRRHEIGALEDGELGPLEDRRRLAERLSCQRSKPAETQPRRGAHLEDRSAAHRVMPPATVTLTRASHDRPPLAPLCMRGVCWGSPGAWNPPAPKPLSKNNLTGIFP